MINFSFINPTSTQTHNAGLITIGLTTRVRSSAGLICVLLIFLASISSSVWALKPSDTPLQHPLHQAPSVDDIARQINQRQQWRILAAEPTVDNAKTLYRFKLLNKQRGRVKVIVIDPSHPNLNKLNQ